MRTHWMWATALLTACLHVVAAEEPRTRVGKAYDPQSGVLLYEEHHRETVADGVVVADEVRYVDAAGRTFARKRVDFRALPRLPEFRLADERTGHFEALERVTPGEVQIQFRLRGDEATRRARLTAPADALADAGFDRFIEEHWDELVAGDVHVRRFLVPSRLEFMNFRIRRDDDGGDPRVVHFALETDSALLRLVVPPNRLVYERATRRLLRYEGLSNLRDATGDNLNVRIDFDYAERTARIDD